MPLQSVAFWGLLVVLMAAYNLNVLVPEYQSIDIQCIVLPVKFDGGLSISVPRNKQLFEKKRKSKVHIFKESKSFSLAPPLQLPETISTTTISISRTKLEQMA
jgi:hypothetical protein